MRVIGAGVVRLVLGVATTAVLAGVAGLHLYWAARGGSVGVSVVPEVKGAPAFQPTRVHSLAVAGALTVGAVLLVAALGAPVGVPVMLARAGCAAMALVLAARSVGDFRRVGVFKRRERVSRFEYWDDRLYTPLCAALSLGSIVVAVG